MITHQHLGFLKAIICVIPLCLFCQESLAAESNTHEAVSAYIPADLHSVEPWGSVDSDGLPLGLYLNRKNLHEIRKWYSIGLGEASKFDIRNPERYLNSLLRSLEKIDFHSRAYTRPSGIYHLSTCAFAYAITKNKNCGNAVRKILLYLAGLNNWHNHPLAPFEESFIVTQMVISYDLVYTILTKKDREMIASAIESKGLSPIRAYVIDKHYWTSSLEPYNGNPGYLQNSNQAPTFIGAIYLGARLLYHHTGKEEYKNEYIKAAYAIRVFLQNYFPDEGSVAAATGYYIRTLTELSYIIVPMAKTLGMRLEDFLPPAAKNPFLFAMYLRSNASPTKNSDKFPYLIAFGDSKYLPIVYDPVNKGAPDARYYAFAIWSAFIPDPCLLWIYKYYVDIPGMYKLESAFTLVSHYYRYLLLKKIHPFPPTVQNERLFQNAGLLIWRDGFKKGNKLFALWKQTYRPGDHLHNDQNTIYLEAFGERYLTDRGCDYKREKQLKFSASINNNSLTIDRENNLTGCSRLGITPYLTSRRLNYARSDASYKGNSGDAWRSLRPGCLSRKCDHGVRSVLYVKPDYYILFDSIHTVQPASVECNFVSACPYEAKGHWISYKGSKSKLCQYVASTNDIRFLKRKLIDDRDNTVYAISIETARKVSENSFLNLLFPLDEKQNRPDVECQADESGIYLKISREDSSKEIIIQKSYTCPYVSLGNIETDCEIAIIFYKGPNIIGGGFFNGTYLKYHNKDMITTDQRASLIFSKLENNVYGKAQAKEGTKVTFSSLWKTPITLTLSNTSAKGYTPFCTFR